MLERCGHPLWPLLLLYAPGTRILLYASLSAPLSRRPPSPKNELTHVQIWLALSLTIFYAQSLVFSPCAFCFPASVPQDVRKREAHVLWMLEQSNRMRPVGLTAT